MWYTIEMIAASAKKSSTEMIVSPYVNPLAVATVDEGSGA